MLNSRVLKQNLHSMSPFYFTFHSSFSEEKVASALSALLNNSYLGVQNQKQTLFSICITLIKLNHLSFVDQITSTMYLDILFVFSFASIAHCLCGIHTIIIRVKHILLVPNRLSAELGVLLAWPKMLFFGVN